MHIHPVAMKAVRRQDVDVEVVVDIEDEDMAEDDVIVRSVCISRVDWNKERFRGEYRL